MGNIGTRRTSFRLYLITDRKYAGVDRLIPACEEALAAGARRPGAIAIQLREKDLGGRELYELGAALRALCAQYGAPLLINDRIDVALALDADGVHLPEDSFAPADARRLLGPSRLIGVSTHDANEAARAARLDADFAVFGPVFDPLSKTSGYAPARGPDRLAAACRTAEIPIYALGGITAERARQIADTGAAGVAAIGSVFGAPSPYRAACELLDALS
ncbi:MAG: thiamine phosphate synthase [Candidatus Binataceae bacterium]